MAGATGDPDDGRPEDEHDEGHTNDALPDDDDAIDESLHSALSDLERMLTRHEGADVPEEVDRQQDRALDDDGEQYTIPLLDDVVIPGEPVATAVGGPVQSHEQVVQDETEPALRARIATRLASEMDVIMQDRLEVALESAREEIRKRVRNHMDIILPEIVDELMQARRREGDG